MKVMLFGATGMVWQGVLRECLLDPDVQSVLSIGRSATGQQHQKFSELVHKDFLDYSSIEDELTGFDAFTAGAREELLLKSAARNRTKEVRQLACEIRHVAL